MSSDSLAENIKQRKLAEEFVELIGEQPERFWECLRSIATSKLPAAIPPSAPAEMTEQQAVAFEESVVPYGKFAGKRVHEADHDYLCWLAEGDDFVRKLRAYFRSARYRRSKSIGQCYTAVHQSAGQLEPSDSRIG